MTNNNEHITELCNQLVKAVRQDIRQELTAKFREEFGTGVATGMHGEPINQARQKTRGQRGKDKRPFRANSPTARIYRTLASRKHGVNINTLCRETGCDFRAVQNAIFRLRQQGYRIETVRLGYRKPKYKLAS